MRVLPAHSYFVHAPEATAGGDARIAPIMSHFTRRLERAFDAAFGARANPLRQLGALACLLLALTAASGVYLYVFFDTGVAGAHASVLRLAQQPLHAGVLMRGLHRYAADAFIAVSVLHLAREWLLGHACGFRWFSWLSGVPLLWLLLAAGTVGFWLAWDELAQFSLTTTLEWIDALRVFGESLARNVLTAGSIDDRFFSLLVFLHIGLPLLLTLGVWLHVQRIARPAVWPARSLALGTIGTLVLLAVCAPVTSAPAADLSRAATILRIDWFYLALEVGVHRTSAQTMWWLTAALTLILALLPLVPRAKQAPVATVTPAHCNGCARCFVDCPYGAIDMRPHPDGRTGSRIAHVDAELCASCGICAGACPSSNPLRHDAIPVSGIDMPQWPLAAVRARLDAQIPVATDVRAPRIVVFGCAHAAPLGDLGEDVATVSLLCAGQLAPSFVQYALRRGAHGVVIVGCRSGGCEFRSGLQWTVQRLNGAREPHLRRSVPDTHWRLVEADADEAPRVREAVEALRSRARTEARSA